MKLNAFARPTDISNLRTHVNRVGSLRYWPRLPLLFNLVMMIFSSLSSQTQLMKQDSYASDLKALKYPSKTSVLYPSSLYLTYELPLVIVTNSASADDILVRKVVGGGKYSLKGDFKVSKVIG
jgi:hypothetical protein